MKGDKIYYCEGYKYQLRKDYSFKTDVIPEKFIYSNYIRLDIDGMLYIVSGYAWDGATDPAIDSKDNMRGSLVHDALSQLARNGYLNGVKYKKAIDDEYFKILVEDGMWAFRRGLHTIGLSIAGTSYLDKQDEFLLEAP